MREPNDQLPIYREADLQLTDLTDPSQGIRPSLDLDPWEDDSYGLVVSYQIFHILPNHPRSSNVNYVSCKSKQDISKILYVMYAMMSWNDFRIKVSF